MKTRMLTGSTEIKAYVHPTRIAILRLLAEKKCTVSGVARELGVHPANLTHHFRRLESAGLIKMVERRDIGRNIEKYYRAAARHYVVDINKRGKLNKKAIALSILRNDLSTAIGTIRRNDRDDIVTMIRLARITPGDLKEFKTRILDLAREFGRRDTDKGRAYTLNMSVYPMETARMEREEIIIE